MKNNLSILWARCLSRSASTHRSCDLIMATLGLLSFIPLAGPAARAQTILGSTGDYAVMAGSTVTNNGVTSITGDLGRADLAGAGLLTLIGAQGVMSTQNQDDFARAFTGLAGMTPTANLSGSVLGNGGSLGTLAPGIYRFDATAQLTGTLTLDAHGQSHAVWVFQIGSTLTTAAAASVAFSNTAGDSVANYGLFWQVGTTTVFGANTSFEGNVLGGTTFDFGSGATIEHGRALSAAGTITLAGNAIDFISVSSGYSGGLTFRGSGNTITAVPEPATYAFLAGALMLAAAALRRVRRPAISAARD